MKRIYALLFLLLVMPAFIFAQEKPTPAEAGKVIDYYYNGKGSSVVLVDCKICEDIVKEGENKNECAKEITDGQINKGEKAILWMKFLVPMGDEADITLRFSKNDKIRKVLDSKVKGAIRYRNWKRIPTNKAGMWKVDITQEIGDNEIALGTKGYTVVEAAQ